MSKGRWIAGGCCGVALLVAVAGGGYVVGRYLRWEREAARAAERRKQVAAVLFTPPADGIVSPERFRVFMAVCRREQAVEDAYRPSVDRLRQANRDDAVDLNGIAGSWAAIGDVEKERIRALSELGMGMREYYWVLLRIGESSWGQPPGEPAPGQGDPGDAANVALFQENRGEILGCLHLQSIRENLDAYRRIVANGAP
jgi:hypothetical protein